MPLSGDSQNPFPINYEERITHLRFKIYPDGGVARLRVYGEVVPDWEQLKRAGGYIDLAAAENGALVLSCSDMFFGHRHNLIMPGRAANMSDGWETKRRRGPGHDWAIIKLRKPGEIKRVEVDTSHFKGNFPESCSLEACNLPDATIETLTDLSDILVQCSATHKTASTHTTLLRSGIVRRRSSVASSFQYFSRRWRKPFARLRHVG